MNSGHFKETHPPAHHEQTKVLHTIYHPYTMGAVINRQVVALSGSRILKSTRNGQTDLKTEAANLRRVIAETSVPVPRPYDFYQSFEFEHLTMDMMPGISLQDALPTRSAGDLDDIADQVVAYVRDLRKLQSPHIQASMVMRDHLAPEVRDLDSFNKFRFRKFAHIPRIMPYVEERTAPLTNHPMVLTHGDLDPGNIMIKDKKVCGLIDWESSGFFPAYWEWMMARQLFECQPLNGWCRRLAERLESTLSPEFHRMWEVEKLLLALDKFSLPSLMPEERERNRLQGWAEVTRILGYDEMPEPSVSYDGVSEHPWWVGRLGLDGDSATE